MGAEQATGAMAEGDRNALLRRIDWRFLVPGAEAPLVLELGGARFSDALRLSSSEEGADGRSADIAVINFPSDRALRRARQALSPGGWVVCSWQAPRPAGLRRAERRLRAAGFIELSAHWAGPLPHHPPQFWLPLGHAGAVEQLLAARPARSRRQALLRRLWLRLARRGLLAPLYVLGRVPGGESGARGDPLTSLGPTTLSLLTTGRRSINKVVGLAFREGEREPAAVAKFARVPEAASGLRREAAALRLLEQERPALSGVPRLLGEGRRAGAVGIVETALHGQLLLDVLAPDTFGGLAAGVTGHLILLAGAPPPSPPSEWEERMIREPLAQLERDFGTVIEVDELDAVRSTLSGLGGLPLVFEHRDCSPWNVLLQESGDPALLDWESSEPRGLPGMDLVYFLANAAFVLEGALESGRTQEVYARLLDAGSPHGRVFAECCARYRAALSLDEAALARLRLLCWVVHCASDRRHLDLEVGGSPDAADLRRSPFLGLLREELARRA